MTAKVQRRKPRVIPITEGRRPSEASPIDVTATRGRYGIELRPRVADVVCA